MILPSTMEASLLPLASCVTQPSFQTSCVIVTGWLLGHGRRVLTRILRDGDGLEVKSFRGYHRFFSTDLSLSAKAILEWFALRWPREVAFYHAQQFLGLEDPQNRSRRP